MTQTNQNKDYSWLSELWRYHRHTCGKPGDICSCFDREEGDRFLKAVQSHIDKHYIGKGEAELKVQEERDRWVTASMKRLARFDETKIPPDVQAYIEQRCIEARKDEQYQTLRILKKLGVIDATAMNKLALNGYWQQGVSLDKAEEQVVREDGEP